MTRVDSSSASIRIVVNKRVVLFILSILSLFAPMFFYISSVDVYVFSAAWIYSLSGHGVLFFPIMFTIPLSMLRLLFVYQMYKYYEGSTTRRWTLVLAILADGPGFALFFVTLISLLTQAPWVYMFYPTPLLFLIGMFILWLRPLPEPRTPWNGLS
jgi:hypothetical protein